jgi:hypothetical protein
MPTGPDPFDQNRKQALSPEAARPAEDLDDLLARPVTLRRYVMRGIVVFAIAFGLILLLGIPTLNSRRQAEIQARATQTASAVTTVLTVTSNLTSASLTLDGKPFPGRVPRQVVLHEGRHTISLIAPPFHVDACRVLVRSVLGGPNLRIEAAPGATLPCSQIDANTLVIPVTGANLPADLQQSARALIRQTLIRQTLAQLPAHTVHIPRGHAYATQLDAHGQPLSQRTATPLTATVSLAPRDPNTDSPMLAEIVPLACASALCASSWALNYAHELPHAAWYVEVPVMEQWRFVSDAGQQVGMLQVAANNTVAGGLIYDPVSGWRLDAATPGTPFAASFISALAVDPCGIGMSLLGWMLRDNTTVTLAGAQAGNDLLQGCVVTVLSQSGGFGQLVWRFGALLAADEQAHALFPNLPLAMPAEVKAAGG